MELVVYERFFSVFTLLVQVFSRFITITITYVLDTYFNDLFRSDRTRFVKL